MPTKKKKYNARFPPARIKKIMQKDEEVGKVASTVPVMISRLLELFTESLISKTNELTLSVNARTLTTSHLKQIILSERKFDFLKDLVAHIPDVQTNDDDGGDSNSDQGNRTSRPRGRPRKTKENEVRVPKKRGRKPKAAASLQEGLAEEENTDDSETEDAESIGGEDADSTSEDATCERSVESFTQGQKRRRIDNSFVGIPGSSSFCGIEPQSCGVDLETQNISTSRDPLLPKTTVAGRWSSPSCIGSCGGDYAVCESFPLNLKTANSSITTAAVGQNFGQATESYLLNQQQQSMGMNFGKTSTYNLNNLTSDPSGLPLLEPPPAHQPIGQAVRMPFVPSYMIPPMARVNMPCETASESVPDSNLNDNRIAYGSTPVATTISSADSALSGSQLTVDRLHSPSPPVYSLPVLSSGHAIHRMPVVPATFPGALLARSMSVPHPSNTTKQSSLVTLPDEDYDS